MAKRAKVSGKPGRPPLPKGTAKTSVASSADHLKRKIEENPWYGAEKGVRYRAKQKKLRKADPEYDRKQREANRLRVQRYRARQRAGEVDEAAAKRRPSTNSHELRVARGPNPNPCPVSSDTSDDEEVVSKILFLFKIIICLNI